MQWVVTGYHADWDGFLYIVEAETAEKAFERVRDLNDDCLLRFDPESDCWCLVLNDPTVIENPDRWTHLYAAPAQSDLNLKDAVCW